MQLTLPPDSWFTDRNLPSKGAWVHVDGASDVPAGRASKPVQHKAQQHNHTRSRKTRDDGRRDGHSHAIYNSQSAGRPGVPQCAMFWSPQASDVILMVLDDQNDTRTSKPARRWIAIKMSSDLQICTVIQPVSPQPGDLTSEGSGNQGSRNDGPLNRSKITSQECWFHSVYTSVNPHGELATCRIPSLTMVFFSREMY